MLQLQTLTTEDVPASKRLEFWNDAACQRLAVQMARPFEPGVFSGSMMVADFGDLRMIDLESDATSVVRTRAHIARSNDPYFIVRMQLKGESISIQDAMEARLRPGDFTLCDCTRPYKVIHQQKARVLALRVPRTTLLRFIGRPESMNMVTMPGSYGASALTSRYLQDLWRSSTEWLKPSIAPRIANIMLELVASAYAAIPRANPNPRSLTTALRLRIREYIDAHLHDTDLTPTAIAQAFRITPRYLHLLFDGEEETVGRYLMRRRLERCAAALTDPQQDTRSISLICSDYGFKSVPHFCRAFRDHFGVRPGDYRRSHSLTRQ